MFSACCLHTDGHPLVKVPAIRPPGPSTGHSNPRCYLQETRDCSTKISREHVISQSILEQIAGGDSKTVTAGGLPWQDGENATVSISSLASKVLCERHNNALSPLDAAAGAAFQRIGAALHYATKRSLARRPAYFLASGDALERWCLKTLLGLSHSKIARVGGLPILGARDFDEASVVAALLSAGLPEPLGLNVAMPTDEAIRNEVAFAPLVAESENVLGGLRIFMHGIYLDVLTDRRGGNPKFFEERAFYRPTLIDFDGPDRTARMVLTWKDQRETGRRVAMTIAAEPDRFKRFRMS